MNSTLNLQRNVYTSVAAFFFNIAITFISYRLVVQQGGVEVLGLWSALTAAVYLIRIGDVGMGSATERQIALLIPAEHPELARGYLDTGLALNAVLFGTLAGAGWLILTTTVEEIIKESAHQKSALEVLPIMLAGLFTSNLAGVVISGLRGLQLAWLAAWISVAGTLVQLIAVVLLVPALGLKGLALAQMAQFLTTGVAAWVLFNNQLGMQADRQLCWWPVFARLGLLREMFGFSLRAQAVNLLNGLFEPVSKLLVGQVGGLEVLGVYEMAYKLVALPRNAVVAGVHGATPAITRLLKSDRNEARRLYFRSRRNVTLATSIVLVLVVAIAPLASLLILDHVDLQLCTFAALMAIGFWGNVLGAPAYTLGFAAGRLCGNTLSATVSLMAVAVFSWAGMAFCTDDTLATISVASCAAGLFLGGIVIRYINQKLLLDPI